MGFEHLVHKVEGTVARGLGSDARAAKLQSLAGEHTLELVFQFLIHTEEVANLSAAHTDVACRHVLVGSDMSVQLGHKRLTEAHHLGIRASANREVAAALAATHGKCGECIFECLFESQELQDREVHRRVESEPTLIGAYGTVKLHAVADVYMHLALVVGPGHAESDDALGFNHALNQLGTLKFGVLVVNVFNRNQNFSDCLQKLRFARMSVLQVFHDFFNLHSCLIFRLQKLLANIVVLFRTAK